MRQPHAIDAQVHIIIIIMRAILLLAVGAAALKAPKQTALAVRGGGDDSTNEIIMKVSAAAATASGALTILDKSDLVEKYIFFGLNPATSGAAYGVALLGWGVGKINAVQSGAKSIPVWKSSSEFGYPLRHRADAVTGTTSRRWAPDIRSTQVHQELREAQPHPDGLLDRDELPERRADDGEHLPGPLRRGLRLHRLGLMRVPGSPDRTRVSSITVNMEKKSSSNILTRAGHAPAAAVL